MFPRALSRQISALLLAIAALGVLLGLLLAARPALGGDDGGTGLVSGTGDLPRSHALHYGESVTLPDGGILKFTDIIEDSRCPADAMCVWQGRAVLGFTLDGEAFKIAYLDGDGTAAIGGYVVAVEDVQPYPLASQPAPHEAYHVVITVTEE